MSRARASLPPLAAALLLGLLLGGCQTQTLHVVTTGAAAEKPTNLALGDIVFDPPHAYAGDMLEIRRLCQGIGRMYGFTITESEQLPSIHFYLRDRGYTREFLTLHSIGVFSEITSPAGESLYKTYFLQDGQDSLQSLRFVAGVFEKTFQALADRLEAEDRGRTKKGP
jgi:hypothetical protein